jgi:hypothetical protein
MDYAGSTDLKENSEIDSVADKNDCDGESLLIITGVPFIMITLKKARNKFLKR